jgi:RNA recognition motif-containing protein
VKNKKTGKSLCYGFVLFENPVDAEKAIAMRNRTMVGEKVIKVSYAKPSCAIEKECKLLLQDLPDRFDSQELRDLLSKVCQMSRV